jgi:hypothetical protein
MQNPANLIQNVDNLFIFGMFNCGEKSVYYYLILGEIV